LESVNRRTGARDRRNIFGKRIPALEVVPTRDGQPRIVDLHRDAPQFRFGHLPGEPLDSVVPETWMLLREEFRRRRLAAPPAGEQGIGLTLVAVEPGVKRQTRERLAHFFGTRRRILLFGPSVNTYNAPSGPSFTPRMRAPRSVNRRSSAATRSPF